MEDIAIWYKNPNYRVGNHRESKRWLGGRLLAFGTGHTLKTNEDLEGNRTLTACPIPVAIIKTDSLDCISLPVEDITFASVPPAY